ncbi:hypothetical protein evm_009036 [Chilo suppressalis]|nr:hypothetical protein evm_011881 [Chilo suppressalis]RVE46317.1 hypothetical protein evm_009036 [Chilo suppressalis]
MDGCHVPIATLERNKSISLPPRNPTKRTKLNSKPQRAGHPSPKPCMHAVKVPIVTQRRREIIPAPCGSELEGSTKRSCAMHGYLKNRPTSSHHIGTVILGPRKFIV